MTKWLLDLDVIWRTPSGTRPCRIRLEEPYFVDDGDCAKAECNFTMSFGSHWVEGIDCAQVKRIFIRFIAIFQEDDQAEILDQQGNPVDLHALMPFSIVDYSGVTAVPPPGHPGDIVWKIDIACRWVTADGSEPFRLRISAPHGTGPGNKRAEFSADHPLLGDLLLQGWGYSYTLSHGIADFADWHGARIIGEDGEPVDFEALANQLRSS